MSELKACPFCGGEVSLSYDSHRGGQHVGTEPIYIGCPKCGQFFYNRNRSWTKTKTEWNNRPIEDALASDLATLRARLGEAEEGIRRLSWKKCDDCDGSGYTGWVRGKKVSCESCGGSEDSLGDGWIPNHDNIAETMNSALVQRALKGASR